MITLRFLLASKCWLQLFLNLKSFSRKGLRKILYVYTRVYTRVYIYSVLILPSINGVGQGQTCLQEQELSCKMLLWWVRRWHISECQGPRAHAQR